MYWTLGGWPAKEPILLDNYFLAVGKALCLATNFEHNCRFVVQIFTLLDATKRGMEFDAAIELVRALDENIRMLGQAIRRIGGSHAVSPEDIETLRAAKDSRNYIAHEAAGVGSLSNVSAKFLEERFTSLLSHAAIVAKGDNLVSKWCFEIGEKEPASWCGTGEEYAARAVEWVGEKTWEWDIEIRRPENARM